MPLWYTEPHLAVAVIFVVVGFYVLIKGADTLVEGAVVIASRFQLSPAVIGATVVAFGTSLPEMVVSVGSNLKAISEGSGADPNGPAAIAIGNIVGSNIFNVGAILGLSALLKPLNFPTDTARRDYPIMMGALAMLVSLAVLGDGQRISRVEAFFLFMGLIAFTVFAVKTGQVDEDEIPEVDAKTPMSKTIALVVSGILMLMLGGDVSLTGAIALSEWFGLSERVIGLTVMSIGTSLPELATSLQAARRGQADIAVANVVGSNVFNVLCIVGVAGMIIPLPVHSAMIAWDFWWMLGFGAILLWPVATKRTMGRGFGGILFLSLCIYTGLLLWLPDLGA